jgi:hypothetical protein
LGLARVTGLRFRSTDEGVYKIDASQLSNLGYSISADQVPTLKIFGNGGLPLSELPSDAKNNIMNEQEIIVKTEGDGKLSSIIFYGHPGYGFKIWQKRKRRLGRHSWS